MSNIESQKSAKIKHDKSAFEEDESNEEEVSEESNRQDFIEIEVEQELNGPERFAEI